MNVQPEPEDWTDPESVRELDRTLSYTPPTPEQRALDLVGAALLLALASPLFVAVVAYYRVRAVAHGGSTAAFGTERRMSAGEPFRLYKFRTLKRPGLLEETDERVKQFEDGEETTVVGRFLVRTYLDELPQLYNVLRGDMRLVGPRPKPVEVAREEREKGVRRKFLVRPGLTGPDQVQKGYPDRHTRYEGDYRYIYRQQHGGRIERLAGDLKLLVQTVVPVAKAEGK